MEEAESNVFVSVLLLHLVFFFVKLTKTIVTKVSQIGLLRSVRKRRSPRILEKPLMCGPITVT